MWIRTQDRNKLLKCENIQYEYKQKYTDRYIALEKDVEINFKNYINPKTNKRIQNKYEALEYLDTRKEYIDLYVIKNCIRDNYELLGTYATKERALEVLDEIQKEIINSNYINVSPNLSATCIPQVVVYNMPQDIIIERNDDLSD